MDDNNIIKLFTDKKGIVAAVAVLIGLVSGILGIIRPWIKNWSATPDLSMSSPRVTQPPPDSEAGKISFELVNTRGGKAVMKALSLVVLKNGPTKSLKVITPGAAVPQISYSVKLNPDQKHYNLLHRIFGPPLPLRSYEEKEIESIHVEVTSTEPQWYDLQIIIDWHDVENPGEIYILKSSILHLDFPRIESDDS